MGLKGHGRRKDATRQSSYQKKRAGNYSQPDERKSPASGVRLMLVLQPIVSRLVRHPVRHGVSPVHNHSRSRRRYPTRRRQIRHINQLEARSVRRPCEDHVGALLETTEPRTARRERRRDRIACDRWIKSCWWNSAAVGVLEDVPRDSALTARIRSP